MMISFVKSGFKVSNATFSAIAIRYSNREYQISFDDFLMCCVRFKCAFDSFNRHQVENGKAKFDLNTFLSETCWCWKWTERKNCVIWFLHKYTVLDVRCILMKENLQVTSVYPNAVIFWKYHNIWLETLLIALDHSTMS